MQQSSRIRRGRKDTCTNIFHADGNVSRLSIRRLEGLWKFQIKRSQVDWKGLTERFMLDYMAFT